jgi:hypothetical protein
MGLYEKDARLQVLSISLGIAATLDARTGAENMEMSRSTYLLA